MPRKSKKPNQPNAGQGEPNPTTTAQQARLMLAEAGLGGGASLEAEIELQRQVNQRLLALWASLEQAVNTEADTQALQVKVAAALTAGTGRVASLLRDQRALSGKAADGLAAAVAQALDELSSEMGVPQ